MFSSAPVSLPCWVKYAIGPAEPRTRVQLFRRRALSVRLTGACSVFPGYLLLSQSLAVTVMCSFAHAALRMFPGGVVPRRGVCHFVIPCAVCCMLFGLYFFLVPFFFHFQGIEQRPALHAHPAVVPLACGYFHRECYGQYISVFPCSYDTCYFPACSVGYDVFSVEFYNW